jgi:acyl-[acyl-carrier-protein]-phospholipid O-acyltransferase/long-chain-fatty-acid--[acyl-carrier-protein] ligase
MKDEGYILDGGFDAFAQSPELETHLGAMAVKSLSRSPFRRHIVDMAHGRKELKSGMILAVALTMAERWKETIPDKRVGVVFPAGLGGILTNLALTLLGKIPVNLNFSAGRRSIEQSLEMGGVNKIISAGLIKQKVQDFPWPDDFIDLVKERQFLDKKAIVKRLALVTLLPSGSIIRKYNVPTRGGDREAGLLFSSGSTGKPKGIPLTHRNVVSNCLQIRDCHLLNETQTLLACLPTFHSFGFTATMWYPLLYGVKTVTLPSPLETRKIAEAIEQEKVTVMMGTPTFLRPYFKRVKPEQLASLENVVGGAEKTPPGFAERWERIFGCEYLEGYGLTETSPVVSINLPPYKDIPPFKKPGSVGRLVRGMKARVVDPATGAVLPVNTQGLLDLQGPNVFNGYLDNPEATSESFIDGWFRTGDLARIDSEGYIFIEGRISRFSKLGGEMVPHGRVEQIIAECFHLEDAESPLVAVTGVSDETKGEALVLLSAVEIRSSDLRTRLLEAGIPNLWIPRIIHRVDAIPSLASGKLDLKALNALALRKIQENSH